MNFDLAHIWGEMGPLARAIAGVLFLMAIASIGVVIERLWTFRRSAEESRRFVGRIKPQLAEWNMEEVRKIAEEHKGSALARLFGAIARRYCDGHAFGRDGGLTPVELARNEAERSKEAIGGELRRGMSILASVGSVAPFVGLLGTVVGIIGAFQGIATKGSGGLGAVSAGIAEALIETAFGLMVAIPAVLFFNYLTTRVTRLESQLGRSAGELLDDMENHDGRPSQTQLKTKAAA
jgi:biopolymer transport protein ExbB